MTRPILYALFEMSWPSFLVNSVIECVPSIGRHDIVHYRRGVSNDMNVSRTRDFVPRSRRRRIYRAASIYDHAILKEQPIPV